jgi:chromosome segregation ATPase
MITIARSKAKKRGHHEVTRVDDFPLAESSSMAMRNSSSTEQQLLRMKELEAQLEEERSKRIKAEDEVKDLENRLYEEQLNRSELENKVKGFNNAIQALNGNLGVL